MNFRPSTSSRIILFCIFIMLPLVASNCGDNPTAPEPLPLRDTANQSDYLIITPEIFKSNLGRFEAQKDEMGFAVTTVSLRQIADAFPNVTSKQEGIRDFISYTLSFWQEPHPKYVLLVGNTSFVPTFQIPSSLAGRVEADEEFVSLDDLYAINKNEEDTLPDVSLGRLPVSNRTELQSLIDKSLEFENGSVGDIYSKEGLFLVDADAEFNNVFEKLVSRLFSGSGLDFDDYTRIDIRSDSPNNGMKENVIEVLEHGAVFFMYYGFGFSSSWSRADFISVADVGSLPTNKRPFVLLAMTSSQNYDNPQQKSLVEELITLQDGGAVLSVGPSGKAFVMQTFDFSRRFFEAIKNEPLTVGEAVLAVKRRYPSQIPDGTIQRMSILGDPSLRIPE